MLRPGPQRPTQYWDALRLWIIAVNESVLCESKERTGLKVEKEVKGLGKDLIVGASSKQKNALPWSQVLRELMRK